MKQLMENWRRYLNETQWGGFTGGAAPLDTYPTPAEGSMSYEEQLRLFELMIDDSDYDPKELLYHPENIQNGLSFPDLQEEDVEDILSKLGLPELDDPKWQRHIVGRSAVQEAISLDIEIGDIVLGGKYKNKRIEVKEIGTDDIGQPTINGKSLLKFRIEKQLPDNKKSKKTLDMERDKGDKSNEK